MKFFPQLPLILDIPVKIQPRILQLGYFHFLHHLMYSIGGACVFVHTDKLFVCLLKLPFANRLRLPQQLRRQETRWKHEILNVMAWVIAILRYSWCRNKTDTWDGRTRSRRTFIEKVLGADYGVTEKQKYHNQIHPKHKTFVKMKNMTRPNLVHMKPIINETSHVLCRTWWSRRWYSPGCRRRMAALHQVHRVIRRSHGFNARRSCRR